MGIALLVVASLVGLLALPASAATGSLSGTVSDSSAAPIGGVSVDVFEATWGIPAGSTTTQPDGAYSLPVAPGSYRVRFTHPAHPETWSGNTANWVTSATVTIDDGGTTIEDATMADLDTIEGTVTDPDDNPVAGLTVELLYMGLAYRTTPTAADGTYQFTDVPNATFTLGFRDPTGTTWATEYSGGSNTAAGATPITTTGGTTHTIDHTTHPGGSASGRARRGDFGPGVAGIYAAALDVDHLEVVGLAATAADGTWTISNLAPGQVTVAYIDPATFGATPQTGYRLQLRNEQDVLALGLTPAWTTATRYTIASATNRATGSEPLRGWHCDPTTHHPGADLSGSDLDGQNLRGCDLSGADLTGAQLHDTRLDHADLTGAHLVDLVDSRGWFTSARLDGASIVGSAFNSVAAPAQARLTEAQLLSTDHDWTRVTLSQVDFPGVDFAAGGFTLGGFPEVPGFGTPFEGNFFQSNLSGARFVGMDLDGVRFVGTNLTGVDFTDASLVDAWFSTYTFTGSGADAAQHPSTTTNAVFTGADLTGANIDPLQVAAANHDLTGTSLRHITGTADGGLEAGAYGVQPSFAGVPWSTSGYTLTGADLSRPPTVLVPYAIISLANGTFDGMDLTGFSCMHCNLSGGTFTNALLAGANLAGANLANANLTGATGNPAGGATAVYSNTTCPDGTTASPATAQTTCVGHGVGA